MENISPQTNQSYCRCSDVHASDDRLMAPTMASRDSDQPRQRNPRARISSDTGAAIQNATTNSHNAPSACADFSTSPINPGVTSRPNARETKSQPTPRSVSETTPMNKLLLLVQRSA